MGGGHSGPLTGALNFPSPQQGHSASGGGLGDILKLAATVAPMLAQRGGTVPHYESGGDISDGGYNAIDDQANMPWSTSAIPSFRTMMEHTKNPFASDPNSPSREHYTWGQLGNDLSNRFNGAFSHVGTPTPAATAPAAVPLPQERGEVPPQPDVVNPDNAYRMVDPQAYKDWQRGTDVANADTLKRVPVTGGEEEEAAPAKAAPTRGYNPPGPAAANPYMMPQAQQPYPDSLKRDWGQNAVRSPWLALVKAGATMAASPGPIGSVIGKGILAGTAGLEGQRKELRTEQELNDKAQQLYQNAQFHLDKYNRMTMTEEGNLAARNREIDQSGSLTGGDAKTQRSIAIRATQIYNAMERTNRDQFDPRLRKTNEQMQAEAYQIARRMHGLDVEAPAAPVATTPTGPGSSKDNPLPFPGKDVKPGPEMIGKYFIGPDGKVMIWGG